LGKFVGTALIIVCIITVKSMTFYKVFKVKPEKLFVMGKFLGYTIDCRGR